MADAIYELPADVYTSRERWERELAVLFRGQPLVLGLSASLARQSYRALDIAGVPVVLTRDGSGRARAFANACRHRGVRVVDGCGPARRLTCPFHGWTYDLEGRLVGVPFPQGFDSMDREEKGLFELPLAEAYGLLLGRLMPGEAVDVDAWLGTPLADELAMFGLDGYVMFEEPHVHLVEANWKVTLDTFRENYHFNYLHRKTLAGYAYGGVLTFDAFGRHLRNCSAVKSIDTLCDQPEKEWTRLHDHFAYQYALFPNTSMTITADRAELFQILPGRTVDQSIVWHTVYCPRQLDDGQRQTLSEMIRWVCEAVVGGEDFWVAERTVAGLRSGLLDTVVFGRNEPAPQHLHKAYQELVTHAPVSLPPARLPAPRLAAVGEGT
jgi:phenylpropionate dioxygenase-like ring-hydroxylating dioxygenase large terminal subunit